MAKVESRVVFKRIRTAEADDIVLVGSILQKLSEKRQAQYIELDGHSLYDVIHSPAGELPKVTDDGWIPLATGMVCWLADKDIETNTVRVEE